VSGAYEGRQIVGMDLHRRRSVLVRMTDTGERLETVRISNDPQYLAQVMARAGEAPEVVLEAAYGWYWAADALAELGARVHLAHPLGANAPVTGAALMNLLAAPPHEVSADDAPSGQRVDVECEVVRPVAARPRPQWQVPGAGELGGILDHPEPPEGEQAPSVLPHLVDVVDLEGHAGSAGGREEFPSGARPEVDDVAVEGVVHW
jgi:hypothetical protein